MAITDLETEQAIEALEERELPPESAELVVGDDVRGRIVIRELAKEGSAQEGSCA